MGILADFGRQIMNRRGKPEREKRRVSEAPEEERQEVALLMALLENGRRMKDLQTQPWQPGFEYYMGKQLDPLPDWKASTVLNKIHSTVEVTLALINQQRPRPEFMPEDEAFDEYADHMDEWFGEELEREEFDEVAQDVDKNTLIFGNGFYWLRWCSFEKAIKLDAVHPTQFFVNPGATSIRRARWVAHERQMSLSELLLEYPQADGKVSPGNQMFRIENRFIDETTPDGRAGDTGYPYAYRLDANGQSTSEVVELSKVESGAPCTSDEYIQVMEFWLRDYRVINTHLFDLETGDRMVQQQMLYPNGRHVVMAGNRIIVDEANPNQHGEFPYVEQHCYRVPNRFWSKSHVQEIMSPQDEINKTINQMIDNRNLNGNNQYKYTRSSKIDPDKVTAEPGLGIPVNVMTDFERTPAPPLPQYIAEIFGMLSSSLEGISNVPAVAQGVHSGQMSGVAIEQLLNSVNVAVGFMITNKEQSMKRLGRQWLGLAQQYEEIGKTVVMTDESGRAKAVKITPEQIKHNWGMKIVSGSSIPMNKESQMKWALELVKLQLIGPKTALEAIKMPLARRALREMRRQQEMQHQMQLQIEQAKAQASNQNQGGGPPQSGGPPPQGAGGSPPVDATGQPAQSGPGGMGAY